MNMCMHMYDVRVCTHVYLTISNETSHCSKPYLSIAVDFGRSAGIIYYLFRIFPCISNREFSREDSALAGNRLDYSTLQQDPRFEVYNLKTFSSVYVSLFVSDNRY